MRNRRHSFEELLKIELEGWCYGLANYPGQVHINLINRIAEELQPTFRKAISEGIRFDLVKLAAKFAKAAKYQVDEKEILVAFVLQLPPEDDLLEEELEVLESILGRVKTVFPEIDEIINLGRKLSSALEEDF